MFDCFISKTGGAEKWKLKL